MSNVEVPTLGESITEATLLQWLKNEGDQVAVDEPICELESDKATVDLPAPTSGVLHQIKSAGETAKVGEVIARIDDASDGHEQPSKTESRSPPKDDQEGDAARSPEAKTKQTSKVATSKASAPSPSPQEKHKAEKTREEKPQQNEG